LAPHCIDTGADLFVNANVLHGERESVGSIARHASSSAWCSDRKFV
jgi:hypothetical protein